MSSPASSPAPTPSPAIFAHRGYSARWPEMTVAAYREAVDWSTRTGVPLGLECDVHFSADDELICLHDLDVDRTSDETGSAFARTVAELKQIDFGAGKQLEPSLAGGADPRTMVTLAELLDLVAEARSHGVEVSATIETKHPNPRGTEVEDRVAGLLRARGWDAAGSPCRVISFSAEGLAHAGALLPEVQRTFLVEKDLTPIADGVLPAGVRVAGLDLALLRSDPGIVATLRAQGNQTHVWTVNSAADVDYCLDLGVTGITTDDPGLVWSTVRKR